MNNQYENIGIKVFASPEEYRVYDTRDEGQIADVVRQQVLPRGQAEYHSVSVKVKRKADGSPQYLVTYMLRKGTYTADVVRVEVDENYEVLSFEDDYVDTEDDDEEDDEEEATYESYDFVAATPVPEISTAKEAVERVHQMAVDAGLKSKVLLGPQASVANYKHYLASGLKGFVNVGHGNTSLIVLDDGTLSASWFQGLAGKPLAPAVVYFNSCQVHNSPLQPAVMHAGARTFIGGIVNLGIGTSERVCKCFWDKALAQGAAMGKALKDCEKALYPRQGDHGISGDLGPFNLVPSAIQGICTIQQKSSGRFVDAHESSGHDFSVVTRAAQNNDTQRWILTLVGGLYTIQQKSNNRFIDAHLSGHDYSVVTRPAQNNDTQRWVFMPLGSDLCTYTIQQLSNGRFMDAHESSGHDFSVVTRTAQNNDTQRWTLTPLGDDTNTVQQKSSGRFVDAPESSGHDFSVVTRTAQNNDTQRWILTLVGGVYTIQQRSNGRFVDAHESSGHDYSVVTRTAQNNDTQRWVLRSLGGNTYTIQQLSNGRFMDAHESSGHDFSVVTRTAQNNDTQRWLIKAL
jgi:hypothetical protein